MLRKLRTACPFHDFEQDFHDFSREDRSRIYTIFTIFTILGGPVIGNLPRGLPKRCRCVRNLILEILEILEILLMIYTITSLLSTFPDSLDIALPLGYPVRFLLFAKALS